MGFNEDFFYHVYSEIQDKNISDEFYKQLDKMKYQDKHKYKSVRENWEYAYNKIIKNKKNEAHKII